VGAGAGAGAGAGDGVPPVKAWAWAFARACMCLMQKSYKQRIGQSVTAQLCGHDKQGHARRHRQHVGSQGRGPCRSTQYISLVLSIQQDQM
jgi:hypothetical protein